MARRRRPTEDDSEVNLTPMLDVVFIMLIFFIVTASFVKESALDLPAKDDSSQPQETQSNEAILVQVDAASRIFVQQRQIDVRALRSNLERVKAENPNASLVIQADPEAKNGRIVDIMDNATLAGIANVQFAAGD